MKSKQNRETQEKNKPTQTNNHNTTKKKNEKIDKPSYNNTILIQIKVRQKTTWASFFLIKPPELPVASILHIGDISIFLQNLLPPPEDTNLPARQSTLLSFLAPREPAILTWVKPFTVGVKIIITNFSKSRATTSMIIDYPPQHEQK